MKYTVNEHVLKSGGRGLIINVPDAPVMSAQFHFRAGYRYVRDHREKWETAHIMEHMAFGANNGFPSQQAFEKEFAKNGAINNAYTTDISLCYTAGCAGFEWDRILDLQKNVVTAPLFIQDEFDSELDNVRSELSGYLDEPFRMLYPRVEHELGEDALTYPQRISQLSNITLSDIREHYRRTHTAGNLRFVVAGDFSGKLGKLRDILESWVLPDGDRPPLPVDELHSFSPFVIRRKDAGSITFAWTMNVPRRLSDDETMAMDALDHILTGTLYSGIFGEARRRGLVYSMFSDTSASEHNSSWDFGAKVNHDKAGRLFDLIVSELKRVQDGEISDAEIESAKSYALGRHQMGMQTVGQVSGWLANRYFFDGRIEDFDSQPDKIRAITKERIVETAREFFATNCWGLGLYGNTDKATADKLGDKLAKLF